MTQDDLAQLSREELIQMILVQSEQLAQLKAEYEALRLKLEKSKKPPTNSSNSSQPPSRDHKGSLPADRRKRKHGPPVGHARHERQFVANPDHVVVLKAETCRGCATDLRKVEGVRRKVNQITELPPAKAEVIEVRQHEAFYQDRAKLFATYNGCDARQKFPTMRRTPGGGLPQPELLWRPVQLGTA